MIQHELVSFSHILCQLWWLFDAYFSPINSRRAHQNHRWNQFKMWTRTIKNPTIEWHLPSYLTGQCEMNFIAEKSTEYSLLVNYVVISNWAKENKRNVFFFRLCWVLLLWHEAVLFNAIQVNSESIEVFDVLQTRAFVGRSFSNHLQTFLRIETIYCVCVPFVNCGEFKQDVPQ